MERGVPSVQAVRAGHQDQLDRPGLADYGTAKAQVAGHPREPDVSQEQGRWFDVCNVHV